MKGHLIKRMITGAAAFIVACFGGFAAHADPVAQIGETTYETLQAAIDAATEGANEIVLLADVEIAAEDDKPETQAWIRESQNVVIDMNGKTLTGAFYVSGTATIKNGSIVNNSMVSGIETKGDLTLENMTITSDRHGVRVSGGTTTIISGTYQTVGTSGTRHAINASGENGENTVLDIQGGVFYGAGKANLGGVGNCVMDNSCKSVTISGGEFYGANGVEGPVCQTVNTLISGGTFEDTTENFRYTNNLVEDRIVVKNDNLYEVVPAAAKIGDVCYASLADAIAAAEGEATIALFAGIHTMPSSVANKNIKITGTKDVVVEMLTAVNATGSTIAFNGVTVRFDNDNYEGLQHAAKVTYTDCTHIGTEFLYAPEVVFTNCTFEVYDAATEYAVWTYGAKDVKFNDCVFNTNGKAILVYTEGAHKADIALSDCDFKSNGIYTGKAAVELGQSANGAEASYDLTFTDCTADKNFSANNTESNLWGNKNDMTTASGGGSSVKIDGKNVMPKPAGNSAYVTITDTHTTIWGETSNTDPKKNLYIEILDADGAIMGQTKLNDVEGIYDSTTDTLTWHMVVIGDNSDPFWTTTWEKGYPKADVPPVKALLYVDGEMVNETVVNMSAPDGLNPIEWRQIFEPKCAVVTYADGTTSELTYLSRALELAKAASGDVMVTLENDASLAYWTSVDLSGAQFNSLTIDGNGHVVTDLPQPLIQSVGGRDAAIRNLTIADAKIVGPTEFTGNCASGALIGWINEGITVTITGCKVAGSTITETRDSYAGGLVGYSASGAELMVSDCEVVNCTIKAVSSVGGIVGHSNGGTTIVGTKVGGNTIIAGDNPAKVGSVIGTLNNVGGNNIDVVETAKSTGRHGDTPTTLNVVGRRYQPVHYTAGAYFSDPTLASYGDGAVTADGEIVQQGDVWFIFKVKLGENYYATIQKAIDAATAENNVITLLGDVVESGITVAIDDKVVIDLNGKTVYGDFVVYGDATIKNGTIDSTSTGKSGIEVNNESDRTKTPKLVTEDLTIVSGRHAIRVDGGEVVIDGGSYTAADAESNHAVNISDGGKVTIKDGEFIGNSQSGTGAVAIRGDNSTLNIEDGTFKGGSTGSLTVWGGTAEVTGGTFESVYADRELTIEGGTFDEINKLVPGTEISGGFFGSDPSDYLADGKAAVLGENGKYVIVDAVVSLGGRGYGLLQDAINAATAENNVIMLLDNIAESGIKVAIDDKVVIDLNGKTVTGDFMVYGEATIKNGTIDSTSTGKSGIEVNNESDRTFMPKLVTEDLTIVSGRHALRVDGGEVVIDGGSYTAADAASNHAVNISDGGKVTISGGEFIGNMQSGTGAVAIRGNVENGLKSELTIHGGTFTGGSAGSLTVWGGSTASVNGGTFESVYADVATMTIAGGEFATINKLTGRVISGGTYGVDPSGYVVPEKAAKRIRDMYEIVDAVAVIGEQGYATLSQAIDAATEAAKPDEPVTITILSAAVKWPTDFKLPAGVTIMRTEGLDVEAPTGCEWVGNELATKKQIVTVTWIGSGTVDGIPTGEVEYGTTFTLTATPQPGHVFMGWTGDFTELAAEIPVEVAGDVKLTATFVPEALFTVTTNRVAQETLAQAELIPYAAIRDMSLQYPTIAVDKDAEGNPFVDVGIKLMKATTLKDETTGYPNWVPVKEGDEITAQWALDGETMLIRLPADEKKQFFRFVPQNGLKQ